MIYLKIHRAVHHFFQQIFRTIMIIFSLAYDYGIHVFYVNVNFYFLAGWLMAHCGALKDPFHKKHSRSIPLKLLPFYMGLFLMHFLDWKYMNFALDFMEISS